MFRHEDESQGGERGDGRKSTSRVRSAVSIIDATPNLGCNFATCGRGFREFLAKREERRSLPLGQSRV